MNEYPSIDDVALRILELLASIFPRDATFEEISSALPDAVQDEILSRMDDMQKLEWIDGSLIRSGVDNSVKGAYRCHLTSVGRSWLEAQGMFDLEQLAELCERKFKGVRDFAYEDIRTEFRQVKDRYEKTGIHALNDFVESTCELVFVRLVRIKEAFLGSYLKTVEGTPAGITYARKLWLLRVLNDKWELEVERAQKNAESLTGQAGFPGGRAHPWIANFVGRGRELKKLLENDINVAALERAHRPPKRVSFGTTVVMGDQIWNYGRAGAIGAHSSGVVSEQSPSSNRVESNVDLGAIAAELSAFRKALRAVADTVELDELLVLAGRAQNAAENGSESEAVEQLSRLGSIAAQFAKDQGLSLLSEMILRLSGTQR